MNNFVNIDTIGLLNEMLQQDKPKHPLISVVDFSKTDFQKIENFEHLKFSTSFYCILLKELDAGSIKYGRAYYDFQEGSLFFMSPNQVFSLENSECIYGWGLYFHPDLIKGTSLDKAISKYTYFKYDTNEALHLSDEEKQILTIVVDGIQKEINRPIDKHSKSVIVSGLELLLNHCMRFYDRQFIIRAVINKPVVDEIEEFLFRYFQSNLPQKKGLPTVQNLADMVNLSPNYLSDLLKKETGKTTQEHIHYYLLDKAKSLLLNSNKTVNEIAYTLGFDYPQYFSKIFKSKIGYTPSQFRKKRN